MTNAQKENILGFAIFMLLQPALFWVFGFRLGIVGLIGVLLYYVIQAIVGPARLAVLMLLGLCLVVLSCTACGGAAAVFSVGDAIFATAGVVIASLSAALGTGEAATISGWIARIQALWDAAKTATLAFVNGSAGGTVAGVQAAIAALQTGLKDIESAANIQNATLKAWIAGLTSAIGGALAYVVENVLPKAPAAMAAHTAGDSKPANDLDAGLHAMAERMKHDYEAAITSSGLDAATIISVTAGINHRTAHHVLGVRV